MNSLSSSSTWALYIFENVEAQRVKVGATINRVELRLRDVNDKWMGVKVTCQICGEHRLVDEKDKHIPTHTATGSHRRSGLVCAGSGELPLETDSSIAEAYLHEMKLCRENATGAEKGSLTRMISNLRKRIQLHRGPDFPVGKFRIAVIYYIDLAGPVEKLAHQILDDRLDRNASIGEVFHCSLSTAIEAVDQALSQLDLNSLARKEFRHREARTASKVLTGSDAEAGID